MAKKCDFTEGTYALADAEIKLNDLISAMVNEIDTEVKQYDFKDAIPCLIKRIDALNDQHFKTTFNIKCSLEHEVDYKREENYANRSSAYITMHKNYRYLIEKFVQLEPKGQTILDKEHFQYLLALIDWLHVFYSASDSIHYEIHPTAAKIDNDYRVDVVYEKKFSKQEKEYAEEDAKLTMGLTGNLDDRVSSPRATKDFMDALDTAFMQDLQFTFRGMINVLQILSLWAQYRKNAHLSPFYSATADEIKEVCLLNIEGINQGEIHPVLSFLTLRSYDVIHLTGQTDACLDIPVWEYKKRYARYNLRPLIMIDDKYFWGPHSVMKSGIIWSGSHSKGVLPADLKLPTIQRVFESEKKLIEDALEGKAFEIINRYTNYSRKNLELYKFDKKLNHPREIGDYDVLAFYQKKNIVLNIECKDIVPAHCLKDAKTLRETIFGKDDRDEGHFRQINKRLNYLSLNLLEIAQALKWPIDVNNLPKIITIYLTRTTYWWTKFPPKEVKAIFLRVDMLSKFIEDL